ncbi:hypothetical protein CALCODRAFT_557533 [Calocera cornea HHB12733]|uniref:Amidoligase enzyme n=1 Tax=Calocera cornea HHB12733 TaxID=1353952 RepID=A0A165DSI2_9BASI|nr:hypothetical protein CALCODRAFT_557533 [Calocera cornea HHB12733]
MANRALTLGFEVKCIVGFDPRTHRPPSPTYVKEGIAQVIRSTKLGDAKVRVNDTDSAPQSRSWFVAGDESIETGNYEVGVEIISPPFIDIPGEENLRSGWRTNMREVLKTVHQHFALRTDSSAGLHVHLGVGLEQNDCWSIQDLRKLALIFTLMEPELNLYHPRERWDMNLEHVRTYIRPLSSSRLLEGLSHNQIAHAIRNSQDWEELTELLNADWEEEQTYRRQYAISFCSMGKYGTIEFRQHKCTTSPEEMIWWAERLLKIARVALSLEWNDLQVLCSGNAVMLFDLFTQKENVV